MSDRTGHGRVYPQRGGVRWSAAGVGALLIKEKWVRLLLAARDFHLALIYALSTRLNKIAA